MLFLNPFLPLDVDNFVKVHLDVVRVLFAVDNSGTVLKSKWTFSQLFLHDLPFIFVVYKALLSSV